MKINPVGWFEIYVQDIARARKFYESVFQVKLEQFTSPETMEIEMWGFPMFKDQTGCGGAIVKMKDVPSGGNSVLVYFMSADCANEAGRVIAAGGELVRDKFAIGQYGYIALVMDTEGNMIGLHSMQ